MVGVEVAHLLAGGLGLGRGFGGGRHLGAQAQTQRVGGGQVLVVAAGVEAGQHREQALAGFQRNLGGLLCQGRRRQPSQQRQHAETASRKRVQNRLRKDCRWGKLAV